MMLFVFLTILYALQQEICCILFENLNETEKLNLECDKSDDEIYKEGNIGQTPLFPWLGVLRVHIHEHQTFKIAVTGLVLVKEKFAIVNANDLAKIPINLLRTDSKVMFITDKNRPWNCKVVDYMPHPEFEITTMNTIGILELYSEVRMKPKPICWPSTNFNTSNQLYVIGYTDENQIMEKTIFQLQYVNKDICLEFYNRSKLLETDIAKPVYYQCGFGIHSKGNCIWDNGRVVASNASGQWTLIGLIITGPGCAAPARFIDTTAYMPWIITAMNLEGNDEQLSEDIIMRRKALRSRLMDNRTRTK